MANLNPLALYALASVLLIIVGWRVTRNWRPVVLGRLLRVWLAVLLMTPAYVEAGINAVAPAWVVTLFIAAGDGLEAARIGWLPLAVDQGDCRIYRVNPGAFIGVCARPDQVVKLARGKHAAED